MSVNQLAVGVLDYSFIKAKRGQQQGMKGISFLKGLGGFLVKNFRLILDRIRVMVSYIYILQVETKKKILVMEYTYLFFDVVRSIVLLLATKSTANLTNSSFTIKRTEAAKTLCTTFVPIPL
jgi:hypothetical protein